MLLGDFSLDDSQEDMLLEPEPAAEELSLEDSLSLLAGDDDSDDLLLDDDSSDALLEDDEVLEMPETETIEDIVEYRKSLLAEAC